MRAIDAFCINLDRDYPLYEGLSGDCARVGIALQRLSATIASEDDTKSIRSPSPLVYRSMAELGCLISHLRAIQQFLNGPAEFALILEDDAWLSPFFNMAFLQQAVQSAPANWEVLQLGSSPQRVSQCLLDYRSKYGLLWHRWVHGNWGCHAYLITRQGAKTIASQLFRNNQFSPDQNYAPELQVADFLIYDLTRSFTSTYPFVGYKTAGNNRISNEPGIQGLNEQSNNNPSLRLLTQEDFASIWGSTQVRNAP